MPLPPALPEELPIFVIKQRILCASALLAMIAADWARTTDANLIDTVLNTRMAGHARHDGQNTQLPPPAPLSIDSKAMTRPALAP